MHGQTQREICGHNLLKMPAKEEKAYARALLDVPFTSPRGWLCLPIVAERGQMRRGLINCLESLQVVTSAVLFTLSFFMQNVWREGFLGWRER